MNILHPTLHRRRFVYFVVLLHTISSWTGELTALLLLLYCSSPLMSNKPSSSTSSSANHSSMNNNSSSSSSLPDSNSSSSNSSTPTYNVASVCPRDKYLYELCFHSWYTSEYLTGKSTSLDSCKDLLTSYRQCVIQHYQKHHPDVIIDAGNANDKLLTSQGLEPFKTDFSKKP